MKIPFTGETYTSRSLDANTQECINWYPETDPTGRNQVILYPCPGKVAWSNVGVGPIRGMREFNGNLFAISGNTLFKINSSAGATSIGTISTSTGIVSMADNGTVGNQFLIVDGTAGYIYNDTYSTLFAVTYNESGTTDGTTANKLLSSGATFTTNVKAGMKVYNTTDTTEATITAVDSATQLSLSADIFTTGETYVIGDDGVQSGFPDSATHAIFVDGYFLVNDISNNGRFWKSDSYDGTAWDGLAFATAERSPDALKAIENNHRNVYMIGDYTTEVWYNTGSDILMPFSPVPGAMMEVGIAAPYSVAKHNKMTIWLAQDKDGHGQVIAAQGADFKVISNYAIESTINEYSTIADARGWTYQQAGHPFYVLTFPSGNETWVYDFNENKWHQRQSYNSATYTRDKGEWATFFASKVLVGSNTDGNIWQLDLDTHDEDGDIIRKLRKTQHIHTDDSEDMFFRVVRLKFEGGIGTTTTPNPQVKLRWSDDGGHTWTNQMTRTLYTTSSTGSSTSTSASKLINSGATFSTDGVQVGMNVYNTTDGTNTTVVSVDSETQLTLADDIFVSGEEYQIGDFSSSTHGTYYNFRKLKYSDDRVFEIECSDKVKYVLIAGYADITKESGGA